ncbi:hypothetical protein KFE25_003464 [Diacronema lutheri]|uniref:GH18 domain-containing protein n=1 Tax=Diacronema lutheri TaxID=2081491 RepID=A0A8J5XFX0_DIALT|nr:hypothetical protein KFE25_003464 [Diacronema lutheri]
MSRGLCTLALMATGWRAADAHGHMSKPAPREPLWLPQYDDGAHTAVGATYRWDEPVYTIAGPKSISGHQYSANAFRCRESRPSAPPFQQLVAGQTIDVEWTLSAVHPGDCYLYLSYDTNVDEPERWFKIAEFPGCTHKADVDAGFNGLNPRTLNTWPVRMPTWLASCSHCVLRWEWISVQQVVDNEYFATCADVQVTGTAEPIRDFIAKVSPIVSISSPFGHLPSTIDACTPATIGNCYRRAYNGQFGTQYLLAPEVASYGGSAPGGQVAIALSPWRSNLDIRVDYTGTGVTVLDVWGGSKTGTNGQVTSVRTASWTSDAVFFNFAGAAALPLYYASWAIYGRDHKPWEMQLDKITHVNYAFFDVTAACAVTTLDSYADYDIVHTQLGMSWGDGTTHGNIGAFQRLRAQHPHLKLLLSLGGWTKSTYFSGCAKTAAKRATIVSTALQQLERSDFDGIDVDWEYPIGGGLGSNQVDGADWANYVLLLTELRAAMDAKWPARRMELTIAMGMNPRHSDSAPMEALAAVLDAINLMTYDYNGAWASLIAHNAPLHEDPAYAAAGADGRFRIDWGVDQWVARVPAHKLVLGLAAYGRAWTSVAASPAQYSQASGALMATYAEEPGMVAYWDIARNYVGKPGWTRGWNDLAKVPYLVGAGKFISYDDAQSIALKVQYAKGKGLGGIMWWEASEDKAGELVAVGTSAWTGVPAASPSPSPSPTPSPSPSPSPSPTPSPTPSPSPDPCGARRLAELAAAPPRAMPSDWTIGVALVSIVSGAAGLAVGYAAASRRPREHGKGGGFSPSRVAAPV